MINVLPFLPKHMLTTILPYLRKGDEVITLMVLLIFFCFIKTNKALCFFFLTLSLSPQFPQVSRKLAEQVLNNAARSCSTPTNFKSA